MEGNSRLACQEPAKKHSDSAYAVKEPKEW
jgi:hypothetical protein